MTHPSGRRTASAIDTVADAHLDAVARLDPVVATFAGLSGHDDRLTDYSPAGHAARAEQSRRVLAELAALSPTDAVDAVTRAAMAERLGLAVEQHEAGLDLADLNNTASPVQSLREVFDVAPTATAQDWTNVRARLAAMPRALAGYRESLLAAVDGGWRPAARQVLATAGQAEEFAGPEGFFAAFTAASGGQDSPLPAAVAQRIAEDGAAAGQAYAELAGWLRRELLPVARESDAAGRDAYGLYARGFLGTEVDVDETYAWGLEELSRIEDRMAGIARRLDPGATGSTTEVIAAGIAVLDADPARRIEGAEAFRDWMQQLSDTAIEQLGREHFDIAAPLRRLVCRIAPSTSGAVYYTAPSEDLSRPGQIWWAVPPGVTSFSTWQETSTVYHEGVPGHHLQNGHVIALADRLNRWRRLGCWVSGHGEGWALYAERLMEELGHLEDLGDRMGMLDAHALRACRVVVDLGVHCGLGAPQEVGGGTWDADKAWAFLRRHTRIPDPNLRFELDRYLGWPGQAISYKVGERVWLDLRESARARLGEAFDLRDFHRESLDVGSVGLDVLRDAVLGRFQEGVA
ncbi:MAG TPA: DUF885 domain-containing protein [Kineosporiaceae bacterium]|nr:DUF885 domain-containing protein [Kineosporiaceae bacterium]